MANKYTLKQTGDEVNQLLNKIDNISTKYAVEQQNVQMLDGEYAMEYTTKQVTIAQLTGERMADLRQPIRSKKIAYDTSFNKSSFNMTYGSVTKAITYEDGEGNLPEDGDYSALGEFFQRKINEAFGENRISVYINQNTSNFRVEFYCNIEFFPQQYLEVTSGTLEGYADGLEILKITSGTNNKIDTSMSIEEFTSGYGSDDGSVVLTINGYTENFTIEDSLDTVMNRFNQANNNITFKYAFEQDAFIITDSAEDIQLIEASNILFAEMGLSATYLQVEKIEQETKIIKVTSPKQEIYQIDAKNASCNVNNQIGLFDLLYSDMDNKIKKAIRGE